MTSPEPTSSTKRVRSIRLGVAVLALLGLLGWRVFEHFDQQDKVKNAGKPCSSFDRPAGNPVAPAGFTLPAGQKLLTVQRAGKTSVLFASLPGTRSDLVLIRDQVAKQLAAAGYEVTGRDQEPTFEADATISKNGTDDTINVRPLCSGRVVVRYTLH
ncbi:MAG: hypothetical protein NVS3B26_16870 [Mycobacteriales bacterium]